MLFPLADCCQLLSIDLKTFHRWLRHAHLPLHAHPTDARLKCLTLVELQHLAAVHARPLSLSAVPSLRSARAREAVWVGETKAVPSPHPLPAAGGPQTDLIAQLASLEAQIVVLQEQLAQLTALLTPPSPSEQTSTLSERTPALFTAEARSEPGPQPHRAESRRPPLLPLIEYGAEGRYVVICPLQGELLLVPDSEAWFSWLASLSSFRFVGQSGRFSACRGFSHGPKRTWHAYRIIHQHTHKHYLGVTEHLTLARMEQVAALLCADGE